MRENYSSSLFQMKFCLQDAFELTRNVSLWEGCLSWKMTRIVPWNYVISFSELLHSGFLFFSGLAHTFCCSVTYWNMFWCDLGPILLFWDISKHVLNTIRVPRIENRVPRIREYRVPTDPHRKPNIFLKKNPEPTITISRCASFRDDLIVKHSATNNLALISSENLQPNPSHVPSPVASSIKCASVCGCF